MFDASINLVISFHHYYLN